MMYVGLVEKLKNDSSLYSITQKGINFRTQFQSIITMMQRDVESFQMKNNTPNEIMAYLKTKMH